MTHVLGLDLSLTATGVAVAHLDGGWDTTTLKPPPKQAGLERLGWIRGQIGAYLRTTTVLVVVEGPAYGAQGRGQHERAGLWWLVRWSLENRGFHVAVAPPASVKKYSTGRGNAQKGSVMLAAGKRFPDFDGDDNAADALWLAAMGAERLGAPMVELPKTNRAALDGVAWPDLVGDEK